MKFPNLTLGFLLGAFLTSILFAWVGTDDREDESGVRRMKIAHNLPQNHPLHAGVEHLAERLAHYSNGRLQLDIFPNGQLGADTQAVEQMQSGTLDMAKVGGATLGSFIPVAKVFSLPYLFRDGTHYWQVLDGEIGQALLDELSTTESGQASGLHGLTYYDAGSRNFYAKKPILSPEDLEGVKVRVMNDPVAIETMKALGASPTPISWGELYTALQQGVVDGAENNPPSFVSSRHFEICKEFSFDHHSRIPDVLIISQATWDSLSEVEREWFRLASADSSQFQREAWAEAVDAALLEMEAQGVTIHEVDLAPFASATEAVRERMATGKVRDYMERIQAQDSL